MYGTKNGDNFNFCLKNKKYLVAYLTTPNESRQLLFMTVGRNKSVDLVLYWVYTTTSKRILFTIRLFNVELTRQIKLQTYHVSKIVFIRNIGYNFMKLFVFIRLFLYPTQFLVSYPNTVSHPSYILTILCLGILQNCETFKLYLNHAYKTYSTRKLLSSI